MVERTILPETRNRKLETRQILGYDPNLDLDAAAHLDNLKHALPYAEYERKRIQFEQAIRRNLETALGERFNVEISIVNYQLIDGQLKSDEYDEPFLDRIKRGQRYRQLLGSREVKREKAEVLGFARLEQLLPQISDTGSEKIIIISPQGDADSVYQHNFFDFYQKIEPDKVKMSRYTSSSTLEDFGEAAKILGLEQPNGEKLNDAFFLSHPIVTGLPREQIIELFHPQEDTMPYDEYQTLILAITPLINKYIEVLKRGDDDESKDLYRIILNVADEFVLNPQTRKHLARRLYTPSELAFWVIPQFSTHPVRFVAGGCGPQTLDFSNSNYLSYTNSLPFSVSEYGNSTCPDCQGAENHFHCPGCGSQIESGKGITKCPHCGLTKEEAGSKC